MESSDNRDLVATSTTFLTGTFEWLTNFDSIAHLLDPEYLFPNTEGEHNDPAHPDSCCTNIRDLRLLNIGCGSSNVGEKLLLTYSKAYTQVTNVDRDVEIIDFMRQRTVQQQVYSSMKPSSYLTQCPSCNCKHHTIACSEKDELLDHESESESSNKINKWIELDFSNSDRCKQYIAEKSFDVVLDKSTLDCALCSQDTTSSLLAESYRALRPNGGIFFLITFHSPQLIVPLLKYLYHDIEYCVVDRMVDDYYCHTRSTLRGSRMKTNEESNEENHSIQMRFCSSSCREIHREKGRQRSSNFFILEKSRTATKGTKCDTTTKAANPSIQSAKTVNVFVCRKNVNYCNSIGLDLLQEHIIRVCNDWYMVENPLVTHVREDALRSSFREKLSALQDDGSLDGRYLPLEDCYDILFTNNEKSNLPYEYFLEDWNAFVADSSNLVEQQQEDGPCINKDIRLAVKSDAMTLQVALQFLKAMQ